MIHFGPVIFKEEPQKHPGASGQTVLGQDIKPQVPSDVYLGEYWKCVCGFCLQCKKSFGFTVIVKEHCINYSPFTLD